MVWRPLQAIARLVVEQLGGPAANHRALQARWAACSAAVKRARHSVVVRVSASLVNANALSWCRMRSRICVGLSMFTKLRPYRSFKSVTDTVRSTCADPDSSFGCTVSRVIIMMSNPLDLISEARSSAWQMVLGAVSSPIEGGLAAALELSGECVAQLGVPLLQVPIGSLSVGLSRHRAVLFKYLADASSLQCRLLRGSYIGVISACVPTRAGSSCEPSL